MPCHSPWRRRSDLNVFFVIYLVMNMGALTSSMNKLKLLIIMVNVVQDLTGVLQGFPKLQVVESRNKVNRSTVEHSVNTKQMALLSVFLTCFTAVIYIVQGQFLSENPTILRINY